MACLRKKHGRKIIYGTADIWLVPGNRYEFLLIYDFTAEGMQQPCVGSDALQAAKHLTQNSHNNLHFVRLLTSITSYLYKSCDEFSRKVHR